MFREEAERALKARRTELADKGKELSDAKAAHAAAQVCEGHCEGNYHCVKSPRDARV